jgi:hypothetical protein
LEKKFITSPFSDKQIKDMNKIDPKLLDKRSKTKSEIQEEWNEKHGQAQIQN